MGRDVEGKDVLIVDDMIASGESVLDIAMELKERKARNVYVATTFAFFTEGLEKFNRFYEDGIISRVLGTPEWYVPVERYNGIGLREASSLTLLRFTGRHHSPFPSIVPSPVMEIFFLLKFLL